MDPKSTAQVETEPLLTTIACVCRLNQATLAPEGAADSGEKLRLQGTSLERASNVGILPSVGSQTTEQPQVMREQRPRQRLSRRQWLGLAGGLGLFGVGTWLSRREPPHGVRAPRFRLETVANGEGTIELGASSDGRLTVLDFFAGWCSDCAEGVPRLEQLPESQKVRWVSVGVDRSSEIVRKSALKWKLIRPVVYDQEREVADAYGINAYPTLIIIDAQGTIAATHVGPTTNEAFVQSLMRAGLEG